MAASMRDGPSSGNHTTTAANFEYDDNEWDIGIGDLIIDLDADIEKTGVGEGSMAAPKPGKMHSPVEHQATVDKGLKMKIKRTKPGTKHEIVKSGENGEKHSNSAKRGSSSHKRDKKHGEKPSQKDVNGVVRCVERVVYPVINTPPIKEKESSSSSMGKKVKGGAAGVSTASSGSSGSVTNAGASAPSSGVGSGSSGSAVLQCSSASASVIGGTNNNNQVNAATLSQSSNSSNGSSSSSCQAPVLSPAQGPTPSILLQQASSPQSCQSNLSSGPPGLPQLQPVDVIPRSMSQHVVSQSSLSSSGSLSPPPLTLQVMPSTTSGSSLINPLNSRPTSPSPPPPPLNHMPKELVDVCVGTSVGTITEPDCLGPCEPGTSVTLEGIVWHETEGVLVVNVTWRGKTYVGTLLDCTRHDWAPPRFCDSPTSDMDARTPKGRGKRGRNAAHSSLNDLSNFTETRSSVHSKLRSNNANLNKGRRGPGAASPTPFATPKADATPVKRKTKTNEEEPPPKRKAPPLSQPTSPLPPPTLLECPEPNCSKKYKHINGLKYHQSHAHGSPDDEETKESATSEEEEPSPILETSKKDELCEVATQNTEDNLPELEDKSSLRKYPEEPSPPEPSPPVLANSAPPIIIPTTPPPPAPSPPTNTVEENVSNLSILSQPPVLTKVPQFKVKPSSALLSDEKKPAVVTSPNIPKPSTTLNQKKKNRKSPTGSPDSTLPSPLGYEEIEAGREEVQSPAYSDISDDAAPLLESEVEGKSKPVDKKEESPQLQHYGMFQYYGQPPYLVPSVSEKTKDPIPDKTEGKIADKDKKESNSDYQQKMLSQHYYQYGYHVPGFSYNMDGYPVVVDDKKDEKTSVAANSKTASNSTLHIPNPGKPKVDPIITKEKHQNENHQILKESIDMKNQVNPGFLYHRQPTSRSQEDVGSYYAIYPDRKDSTTTKATPPPPKTLPSPSPKHKEKPDEKKERREDDKKQEGVKPTMETQGPPPPPTSQYAYIHPGYMQSPHYGTLPFEPVYRGMNPMLVSGYPNSHYLHPQLHAVPRYAPEDLSRSQSGKALDLLQHHASQYYSPSHKIHELQERAIKSPTPKTTTANPSPSTVPGPISTPVTSSAAVQVQGKSSATDPKDARSPPPQRHVHTHHHTHVGLGYPILTGQYPAPYGAAVLATEHAAAVTSVPYQAK